MSGFERRQAIAAILRKRSSLRVTDLADRFNVSEVTVRKDLALLEEMGLLRRTHGGAVLAEQVDEGSILSTRRERGAEAKRTIALRAKELISHGDTILIDAGSTCAYLAEAVAEMELRVITNSLEVLVILADKPSIALHATGGAYRHNAGSFIGPDAEQLLQRMQFDHAFIGATGISREGKFSAQNSIEAEFKRTAIAAARSTTILADGEKLGRQAFSVFAGPEDVDLLVTTGGGDVLDNLRALGVEVLTVPEATSPGDRS